eukprot:6456776-Amphidinium_carterae.1
MREYNDDDDTLIGKTCLCSLACSFRSEGRVAQNFRPCHNKRSLSELSLVFTEYVMLKKLMCRYKASGMMA